MKIFVDMDSTLNDFTKGYVDYYNRMFDKNISIERDDLKQYEISKAIHALTDDDAIETRQQIFSEPGFWFDIPAQENAVDTMKKLQVMGHELYILTAPWKQSINCYTEKIQWIEKHLPWFDLDKVIYCRDKYLIHGDVIIDDNPSYLTHHSCEWAVAPRYPFNENLPAFYFDNWSEVPQIINEIDKIKNRYGRVV